MIQHSRTINEGRSQREFEKGLKVLVEENYFKTYPQEKIENGLGHYPCKDKSLLVVEYQNYKPLQVTLLTSNNKNNEETSRLLGLLGML